MAGDIYLADGRSWGARSSVFYWAIETLSEQVNDPELAAQLREISDENLGLLDVADLSPARQQDFIAAVRRLPDIARATLPQSDGRVYVIGWIDELAHLFPAA